MTNSNKHLFFLSYLITTLMFSHVANALELKATSQNVMGTYFSNFDNLYFFKPARSFFIIGYQANMSNSFNIFEKRGYFWKNYRELPGFNPSVLTIQDTTIFVFERRSSENHSSHFFHFLEHLLGIWNFGGEENRDAVELFVLASDGITKIDHWRGENDVTYHLIKALFPNATIRTWQDFIHHYNEKTLCFEKAITSDRGMEAFKKEPYFSERMLGGYFQLLEKKRLDSLASHVWNYCGVVEMPSNKTRVTYVQRTGIRQLQSNCEIELIHRIQQLPNIQLSVVDFSCMTFKEQVNIAANTDILIGVHGNGLSHTLFLPGGATLIELFPKDSFRVEYRILAKARELKYFGWIDQGGWISDATAETIGWHGNVQVDTVDTNVDAVIEKLKSL